ncbi:MAG: MoaD/ThiS family protein [Nitrospirae bacterium]|nr:MoaD/ThiS family protein [Nitrospirota bacterium]MBI5695707.1 MoaD/ThiS family protein [Nitrospirota bacterium]
MITVELRMLGESRRLLPEKYRESGTAILEAQEGATLLDILEMAGIAADWPLMALVNGRHSEPGSALQDGDVIAVFPPVARR